jgi:hypothetical protein
MLLLLQLPLLMTASMTLPSGAAPPLCTSCASWCAGKCSFEGPQILVRALALAAPLPLSHVRLETQLT